LLVLEDEHVVQRAKDLDFRGERRRRRNQHLVVEPRRWFSRQPAIVTSALVTVQP
jgi:hypothetical protein